MSASLTLAGVSSANRARVLPEEEKKEILPDRARVVPEEEEKEILPEEVGPRDEHALDDEPETDRDSEGDVEDSAFSCLDSEEFEQDVRCAWLDQQAQENHGSSVVDNRARPENDLTCKLFRGGVLTRGAVMDMLAELQAFHHASRAMMSAVVDIINLVALDGGAPAPVVPKWKTFERSLHRSTQHIRKKYFICPNKCKEGVSEWKGSVPRRCTACGEDITITPEEVPKWILRHLDLKESLAAVLAHPGK